MEIRFVLLIAPLVVAAVAGLESLAPPMHLVDSGNSGAPADGRNPFCRCKAAAVTFSADRCSGHLSFSNVRRRARLRLAFPTEPRSETQGESK